LSDEPSKSPPDGAITIRLRRAHLWALAGLLIGIGGGVLLGRATDDPRPVLYGVAPSSAAASSAAPASSSAPVKVATAGRPAQGPKGAKVTMVEFVDFQCPFCGRYARDTLPRIQRAYGTRIRYVSRDFPLTIHVHAQGAAVAAECANEQGGYWRYHRILFQHQDSLDARGLLKHAREAGLKTARFQTCLGSRKAKAQVARDQADGRRYGVTGTPAFFINGQAITGAQPFSQFKRVLDAALKR
jgi:protein-disulfide isomerase